MDLLDAFLGAADGEKDPRCLLLAFECVRVRAGACGCALAGGTGFGAGLTVCGAGKGVPRLRADLAVCTTTPYAVRTTAVG